MKAFILLGLLFVASLARAETAPIYEGECDVLTTGHSGADVNMVSSLHVKIDKQYQEVEIYRSSKAIYSIAADRSKIAHSSLITLELMVLDVNTKQTLATGGADWYSSSPTPPAIRLVLPNYTDKAGPALSEITCMETLK